MATGNRMISPAVLLEVRRLYEETDVSVARIAVLLGINRRTIYRHAERQGWQPRRLDERFRPGVPLAEPPAPAPEEGIPAEALPRRALIARLVRRIEAEIAAVERLVAKAGRERETDGVAETERAARTLAILVRSLRELAALEKDEPGGDDDAARDADAFRRELGETLERVLAAGEAP
ncbi:conserved hypothetical protein [Ancylobacter novellus DSM 506]|uniref:Helix-turn-helix domain-containing protein n=2 Tax=Ancylobacter novellus TaxID=921 RepID=D7A4Y1_ANCN5|nr:conserved hypothetical protein [Ancylobacter novellus DSM 506]